MILNDEALKRIQLDGDSGDLLDTIADLKRQVAERDAQLALATDFGFGLPKEQFDAHIQQKVNERMLAEREQFYAEIMGLSGEPLGRLGMVQALKEKAANRAKVK